MQLVRLVLVGLFLMLAGMPAAAVAQGPTPVSGLVRFADGAPIENALVTAQRSGIPGSAQALTAPNGAFTLSLGDGQWEVTLESPADTTPWMYIGPPAEFSIGSGLTPPSLTFVVSATQALLVGRVLTAAGSPLPPAGPSAPPPTVEVWSDDHFGSRTAAVDAMGAFSIPVVSGRYNVVPALDPAFYPDYDVAEVTVKDVTVGTVSVGDLLVLERNATINGRVIDGGGGGLAGIEVEALRIGGGFETATSGAGGAFTMRVAPGTWELSALSPSAAYVSSDSVVTVEVAAGPPATAELVLAPAAMQVAGRLVDGAGATVGAADGWAYARRAADGAIVAYSEVTGGLFDMGVPAGSLRIGVVLPLDSPYSLARTTPAGVALPANSQEAAERAAYEVPLEVPPAAVPPTTPVALALTTLGRQLTGVVRDPGGAALPSLPIVITATPDDAGAAPQTTTAAPLTGAFTLNVGPGVWRLNYTLGANVAGLARSLPAPLSITVGAEPPAPVTLDLLRFDGVVAGILQDEAGVPLGGQRIWVSSDRYTGEGVSAADGSFSIPVPLVGGAPTRYILGVDGTCDDAGTCLLDREPQWVRAEPLLLTGRARLAQNPGKIYTISRPANDTTVTITGRVTRNNTGVPGAGIEPDVSGSSGELDGNSASNGDFSVQLFFRSSVRTITGALRVTKDSDLGVFNLNRRTVSTTAALAQAPTIDVAGVAIGPVAGMPDGLAATFAAAEGWSFTFTDGSAIRIPPGAVPLGPGDGNEVRVVVEPTVKLPADSQHTWAVSYGYTISLFAASTGKPISAALRTPAELTLRYTQADLDANGAAPARLRPARLVGEAWSAAESYSLDAARLKLVAQTTSLGTWAVMQERSVCPGCVYLPVVGR